MTTNESPKFNLTKRYYMLPNWTRLTRAQVALLYDMGARGGMIRLKGSQLITANRLVHLGLIEPFNQEYDETDYELTPDGIQALTALQDTYRTTPEPVVTQPTLAKGIPVEFTLMQQTMTGKIDNRNAFGGSYIIEYIEADMDGKPHTYYLNRERSQFTVIEDTPVEIAVTCPQPLAELEAAQERIAQLEAALNKIWEDASEARGEWLGVMPEYAPEWSHAYRDIALTCDRALKGKVVQS